MTTRRYPIGIQTFSKIRENDMLYIDKTEYIYNMDMLPERIISSAVRDASASRFSYPPCRAISREGETSSEDWR